MAEAEKQVYLEDDPEYWVYDEDQLNLIAGWCRDGYGYRDIAAKIGITFHRFCKWRRRFPELEAVLKKNREVIDYKVESALLKSALGGTKKTNTITTIMRYGKVVEVQNIETTEDVAPNVAAIKTWLLNRCPDKWKRESDISFADQLEDHDIKIEITRAKEGQDNSTKVVDDTDHENDGWDDVNQAVSIRKATPEEAEEQKREAQKAKREKKASEGLPKTKVEEISDDEWEAAIKQYGA